MKLHRRLTTVIVLLGVLGVAGCSAPCTDSLGVYPPDRIVVTGAEAVDVPHISWTCGEFHSDSMDPPPSVAPDAQRRLQIEVTLEAGSTVEVSFGNEEVPLEPAPVEGANTWIFQVSEPTEPLIVRLCSSDEKCAMYWVNTYGG